jgi:hypothetical protein
MGFSARPQSCAIHTRSQVIRPVSSSTEASTTCAVKEYAGDAPIVPPR